MPSQSSAEHNLMELVAHDPAAAHRTGIKTSVAKEFVAADKGRDLKALPKYVPHKAMGGPVSCDVYPAVFRW